MIFDSTRTDFLEKMKNWVLFAKVQNQGDPFQTERFLHDILSPPVVEKRVLMRVDVRYLNSTLCVLALNHKCLPLYLEHKARSVDLHLC